MYTVFTGQRPSHKPPITKISVDDKIPTAALDRGAGRSLIKIQELAKGEYM